MEKKLCLECNAPLKGRADKRFCDDQCRNNYNNKLNSDTTKVVRNINNILRKNRRILKDLNPQGKAKVHKDKMLKKGFNFQYITNTYTTQKGVTYFFCYDYGYLPLEHDFHFLVKNDYNF